MFEKSNKSDDEEELKQHDANKGKTPEYTGNAVGGINQDTGVVMTKDEVKDEIERRLDGERE